MPQTNMNNIFSKLIVVTIFFLLSACSGDSTCDEGELSCNDLESSSICKDGAFEMLEDCSSTNLICVEGECIEPPQANFSIQKHQISETTTIYLDYSEPLSEYLIFTYHFSIQNESVPYSLNFSDNIDLSTNEPLNFLSSPNDETQERALRYQRDYEMRLRDRKLWMENKHRLTLPNVALKNKDSACTKSTDCQQNELCEDGECKDNIQMYFNAWTINTKINVSVIAKGEKCVLLADNDDIGFSLELSQEHIEDFLNACDNVIVPRAKAFFGDPANISSSPVNDPSDRNSDGLLHVLFSGKVNQERVWGFFSSADYFENSANNPSNERDMLYVSLPEHEGEINTIKATMIHEYQHLLHFVIHNYIPFLNGTEVAYNPVWLDEAFAHLAEEIGGYGIDNVEFVSDILNSFDNYSLAFGSDNLKKRALGFLFVLYLFEQHGGFEYGSDNEIVDKGGPSFLQKIISSEYAGFDAFDSVLSKPIEEMYFDWLVTLAVDKMNITTDTKYNYNAIKTDPVTGNEVGVSTNGERTDNAGDTYQLTGPRNHEIVLNPTEDIADSLSAMYFSLPSYEDKMSIEVNVSDQAITLGVIRIH